MIVLMLPEISFADEEELMDAIYLTVDADAWTLYRVGEDALEASWQIASEVAGVKNTDENKYYISNALLRYGSELTAVSYGDAIMADTQYYYQFSVQANSGYSFNSDKEQMSVYINDVKVTPQSIYYNEYWDLYDMIVAVDYAPAEKLDTTIINSVTFESGVIEQPAIGRAAQSVLENKYSTFYSISNMGWTSSTDDGFKAGDTFTGSATYTLSLVLTPEEGYEFEKNENSEYSGTFYDGASSDGRL